MANVNKVKVNNNVYDIEDTVARSSAVTMSSRADGSVSLSSVSAGTSVNVPSLTNFGDPGLLEDDAVTEINTLKTDVSDLKSQIQQSSGGLTDSVKQALYGLVTHIGAWTDNKSQQYINALHDALYPAIVITAITLDKNSLSFGSLNTTQQLTATTTPAGGAVTWESSNTSVATVSNTGLVTSVGYGNATITASSGSVSATCSVAIEQATVSSISAVYTQSGTVYEGGSLDSLKPDLVVTAHWSNDTTSTVAESDYTLSGTLSVGTSVVTVSYSAKTTTFNVTVTADPFPSDAYQKVEWVGATVNAQQTGPYINTELSEATKTDIAGYSVDFSASLEIPNYAQQNNVGPILGWGGAAATYFGCGASGKIGFADLADNAFDSSVSTGNKYSFHVYWDSEGGKATSGNLSCARAFTSSTLNSPTMKIGTGFYSSTASTRFKYYGNIVVKKGETTLADFYPCYRRSDNIAGFYDIVRGKFYTNVGTAGSFAKGDDI